MYYVKCVCPYNGLGYVHVLYMYNGRMEYVPNEFRPLKFQRCSVYMDLTTYTVKSLM